MTHPFHPLSGREFEPVESITVAGVGWIYYAADDDEALRTMRQSWTSFAAEDPFVRVAAGRSAFHISDLLALGTLLDSLDGDGRAGRETEGELKAVKEILPNV